MTLGILFINAYIMVLLKSVQQLHVMQGQHLRVIPTSYAFALCEIYLVTGMVMADNKLTAGLVMGSGAWMGCLTGMKLVRRKV